MANDFILSAYQRFEFIGIPPAYYLCAKVGDRKQLYASPISRTIPCLRPGTARFGLRGGLTHLRFASCPAIMVVRPHVAVAQRAPEVAGVAATA
jgi:hypothetical protein